VLTFQTMPDVLTLTITAEDAAGCPPRNPYLCPLARKISREIGGHTGIARAPVHINGALYFPAPSAVAFMDLFDDRIPIPYPVTVEFTRKRP